MNKDEIITTRKYTKFKVFSRDKKGGEVIQTTETTEKPMTTSQALKHFKCGALLGLEA